MEMDGENVKSEEEEHDIEGRMSSEDDEEPSTVKKQQVMVIHTTTSTSSSSDQDDKVNKQKNKRKSLKNKLNDVTLKLEEEYKITSELRGKLQEETDAKERLEGYLKELQEKQEESLKVIENLESKLNNSDHYCTRLEKKLKDVDQELPSKEGGDFEEEEQTKEKRANIPSAEDEKEREEEILKLQANLISNKVLINAYANKIEELGKENNELKEKEQLKSRFEESLHDITDLREDEKERFLPVLEKEIKTRLEDMEACLVDQSKLKSEKQILESENATLKEDLEDCQKKYAEAIIALKEFQDAYGNMRDDVLSKYKEEVADLKSRLQDAEKARTPNEGIITGLRQELLDLRLTLERCKKSHREEIFDQNKQITTLQENINTAKESMDEMTGEIEKLNKALLDKDKTQCELEDQSKERMQMVNSLKMDIVAHKDNIAVLNNNLKNKDGEIENLKGQIVKQVEMLNKEKEEKERLLKIEEDSEQLKEENQMLLDEIDDLKSIVKMKKMKIKYVKKQMREIEDQKEKLDSIAFVLPEMKKKVEILEEEKTKLSEELAEQVRKEEERVNQIQQEKLENEERIQREKENWERRLLGIGECSLNHEHDKCGAILSQSSFHRPNSAPLMKPRPPSARRYQTKTFGNHNRNHTTPSGTNLNTSIFNNGTEGKRTSDKVRSRQQRIIMNGKNRDRLFRSATLPMDYVSSYSIGSENNFFPNVNKKKGHGHTGNISPRVLVWGNTEAENNGKKLVAVGDRVLANIMSDCNFHGRATNESIGLVKFIGFVEGNQKDVYIGLRMDEEVGNTDGTVEGKRYFRCEKNRGKFINLDDIVKVLESKTTHHSTLS